MNSSDVDAAAGDSPRAADGVDPFVGGFRKGPVV